MDGDSSSNQEVESAVERAHLAVRSDDGNSVAAELDRPNEEPFRPEGSQLPLPFEISDERRTLWRSHDNRAIAVNVICNRNRTAEQPCATIDKFRANGVKRRGLALHHYAGNTRPISSDHLLGKRIVAQPQAIAIPRLLRPLL
jgi:hypothetical protein